LNFNSNVLLSIPSPSIFSHGQRISFLTNSELHLPL
jgi:hypothetical protein